MPRSAIIIPPPFDPTPIFEHFRGNYGTELLTAAVAHLRLFEHLAPGPLTLGALQEKLKLARRPTLVLTTALRAMGLLTVNSADEFELTLLAESHLTPDGEYSVSDYVALAADSPGVLEMAARLRSNRPAGADDGGAAFIYREGLESAMEQRDAARSLTLALAGRAKNVAPLLAKRAPLANAKRLLDVGGGTGIYSIALVQKHPDLRAIVFDRPAVLDVAKEFVAAYDVADRVELVAGDMFRDDLPGECDAVLLSNILHDWDEPECTQLIGRCATALTAGGKLLIHDVFLNDALDGPLPIALYSAGLFAMTEGRVYSAAEYTAWLRAAGLEPAPVVPTLIHCGLLSGEKRGADF